MTILSDLRSVDAGDVLLGDAGRDKGRVSVVNVAPAMYSTLLRSFERTIAATGRKSRRDEDDPAVFARCDIFPLHTHAL